MQRNTVVVAAAGLVLVASSAFADGRVFAEKPPEPVLRPVLDEPVTQAGASPRVDLAPVPRDPTYATVAIDPVIPDQRALIVQSGAFETLVIETSFNGTGRDFAWVVPTPSTPRIEEASTDLFPALSKASRPDLVSRIPDLRFAALLVVVALVLARHAGSRGRRAGLAVAAAALAVVLLPAGSERPHDASVLTLGSGPELGLSVPMTPNEEAVVVRQREVVGIYDAVTISARDPHALDAWLRRNGYLVPEGLEDVAAQYVRDGWVFNAIRLHRDADVAETVRIHPLAFTFAASEPVYPMRLTGVASGPVGVTLFVLGTDRATAAGFETSLCARISTSPDRESAPGLAVLSDPALSTLVRRATVLTRLDRTFAPDAMDADVPVRMTEYAPSRRVVFSRRAMSALAWNAGALLAIGLFVALASAAGSASRAPRRGPRWSTTAVVLLIGLNAALLVAAVTPTVETRVAAVSDR